ncbi:MAG: DUF4136 domain-containing protein [Flavisolibacter sp.]|nr:DUF4136 domain-containing protein [Flavisolibacter sp.]
MKRMIEYALVAAMSFATLSSCTKDPLRNMTEEESRIYITNRDNVVSFTTYKTFSIVDSVSLIDNNRFSGKEATAWDVQVLSAVQRAMQARGYVLVSRTQSPDLGINVSRLLSTSTNIVSLPDYWGGYGGYYDPYYWGYSGYGYYFPPTYGVYQSTEAALSIDLLDLKNATNSRTIKGVWNGLIRGSGIFRSSNVESQIQALFDQSPYLKANL